MKRISFPYIIIITTASKTMFNNMVMRDMPILLLILIEMLQYFMVRYDAYSCLLIICFYHI